MPRPKTETIKFLTLGETARLFGAVREHPRDKAIFLIAYRHGLRASEVGLLRTIGNGAELPTFSGVRIPRP